MSRNHTGAVRPRPIRVAFLVQQGDNAQLALDGIFADCYYRWGGRFSLIVPCRNERIVRYYVAAATKNPRRRLRNLPTFRPWNTNT